MPSETPPSAAVVVKWGDPLIEASEVPDKYHAEIAALPEAIANVICVELFDWQVRNGGLHQYFFNSYGIGITGAIRGFEAMGLMQCAEIARKARDQFGGEFPEDPMDRVERVGSPRNKKMDFNEIDKAYYTIDTKQLYAALDTYAIMAMNGGLQ